MPNQVWSADNAARRRFPRPDPLCDNEVFALSQLDRLVEATPSTRDRTVDFLRGASIVTVVIGHWFISINHWDGGILRTTSAIGLTPGLWLATWFLQVMPIFFFVGGFSNFVTYTSVKRRGGSNWEFIRGRLRRLLTPSLVLLGVWIPVQVVLHLADIGAPAGPTIGGVGLLRGMRPPGATLPFGPLWFLAVYAVVVTVAPLTIWLHKRFGMWVPAVMVVATVVIDLIGFGLDLHRVRYLNIIPVLLFPHQLGHSLADGTLDGWPRRRLWAVGFTGLGGLVLMTNPWLFETFLGDRRFDWYPTIGHYPKSLLGTDVEPISNAYPPTICFLLVGIWTLAAVTLLRPRLRRMLESARLWKATILVNSMIMTLFLWHMTAYLLALLLAWPLGLGRQQDSTARWWLERPLWLLLPGLLLGLIVILVGRFERPQPRRSD